MNQLSPHVYFGLSAISKGVSALQIWVEPGSNQTRFAWDLGRNWLRVFALDQVDAISINVNSPAQDHA